MRPLKICFKIIASLSFLLVSGCDKDNPKNNTTDDPSLVLHLKMDNSTEIDSIEGTVLATDMKGVQNSARIFDGINDYVKINNDSALNPHQAITLCAWYKTTSFSGNGANSIIDKAFTSHDNPYYQYHLGVAGNLYPHYHSGFNFHLSINQDHYVITTDQYFWEPDNWYFLVGTYDGEIMKFYVNDSLIGVNAAVGTIDHFDKDIYIGKMGNRDEYTPGTIADIKIYNRALLKSEIENLYMNK